MKSRSSWATRFGFYLLAIGSAFGLGNLWRFPYIVGENGGGAFVLLYVFLAFVIGLPLLIGELMLGRMTRQSVVMATQKISAGSKTKFSFVGYLCVFLSLVVLSYYSVISGWVIHFITQFTMALATSSDPAPGALSHLMKNGGLQWGLSSVHLLLALVVVVKGIHEGLEKWIGWMMPFFGALVVLLIFKSLSLPTSGQVLRFLFYPDFSKLTISSLNHAIGHVFFTLSVGFGSLVTFGSYIREDQHVPTEGFRVAIVDTLISLAALLLVFPIAFQASSRPLTDPALLFDVLPQFFRDISNGYWFGLGFFLCLYLAALNASIGLLETVVSNLVDRRLMSRNLAGWSAGGMVLFLTIFPSFSQKFFSGSRWENFSSIEFIDSLLINGVLPLVALALSVAYVRGVPDREKKNIFVDKEKFVSYSMFPQWLFTLRWVAPILILFAWLLQIVGVLRQWPS